MSELTQPEREKITLPKVVAWKVNGLIMNLENHYLGKCLTLLESFISDPEQRKSAKAIARQTYKDHLYDIGAIFAYNLAKNIANEEVVTTDYPMNEVQSRVVPDMDDFETDYTYTRSE